MVVSATTLLVYYVGWFIKSLFIIQVYNWLGNSSLSLRLERFFLHFILYSRCSVLSLNHEQKNKKQISTRTVCGGI